MKVKFYDESIEMTVIGDFDDRNCFVGTLKRLKSYAPHSMCSIGMSQKVGQPIELRPVPLGVKYDVKDAKTHPHEFIWKCEWWYFDWGGEITEE